jgi:Xaa-Pro aminopeptidase
MKKKACSRLIGFVDSGDRFQTFRESQIMSLNTPVFHQDIYEKRRQNLAEVMLRHPVTQAAGGNALLVLFGTLPATRNNDVEHPYRADSDIAYLCGFEEPGCVAVLRAEKGQHDWTLFVRPKNKDQEIWTGFRNGMQGAKEQYGADNAFPFDQLARQLPGLLMGNQVLWTHFHAGIDAERCLVDAIATCRARSRNSGIFPTMRGDLGELIYPMRAIKSEEEIAFLQRAVDITVKGHEAAMGVAPQTLAAKLSEAELEAELSYCFKRGGAARHGYEPIVAAGANACVLHYNENCAPLVENGLVLIDAGAEFNYYTADITRTFPANGKFTSQQRDLYAVTLDAQKAAIDGVRLGESVQTVDAIARRKLAEGLVSLGLLKGRIDDLVEKKRVADEPPWHPGKAALDRFYPHRTGHYLGMDVHDVGPYHDGLKPTPFAPGMVVTVEPGLYVQEDDEEAPAAFRGIGIRIEDDVLVTSDAPDVLSQGLATDPDEVERLVRG